MKLSILIPTLQKRQQLFLSLKQNLENQIEVIGASDQVSIYSFPNKGERPIGEYRNSLVIGAPGEYICFIDDDDKVSSDYVERILRALNADDSRPDVVTFNGWMTTNGASRVDFIIKLGENYEERGGKYYRYPNHLCAIKKSIALQVPFRAVKQQEDYWFATDLRDKGLLKTSVHIDANLYHYDFKTDK